ncbi:MAG: TlpA family protein disulfide reductase [Gemmatimonadetes bacterium]|nr:TlpA family protein disulfide reductase [Gemmatimonadota bacterium]
MNIVRTLAVLTALGTTPLAAQDTGIAVGAMAPGAAVHTLDGTAVNLSTYLGNGPVVIEFWATWCPLCKQLEPALAAAKAKYGDRVTFIGMTVPQNQTPERAKAFVEKNAMKGIFLFDTDGAAYKAYAAPHTSYLVVINQSGKVVYTGVGGSQNLEAALAPLGIGGGKAMMGGQHE